MRCLALVMGSLSLLAATALADGEQWSRFRGPNGAGKSDLQGIPSQWTAEDYDWVIEIPGKGHAAPAIWGDRLFVTTGTDDGARSLWCLNALTGEKLWEVTHQLQASKLHQKNSYASVTPVTNGEVVVVTHGDDQSYLVIAYNFAGEQLWMHDLGTIDREHGLGVSPIIYKNLVIIPNDQAGPSDFQAFDVQTGERKWKTDRKYAKTSYSTPMIHAVNGRDQLITLSGGLGLAGLDPLTGEQLWYSGELPQRTVASPLATDDGLIIGICGQGGRGVLMVAVDPTGRGDVSATHIRSTREQNIPYVPTPIIDGRYMFLWNDDGIVCCVDLSGDLQTNLWRNRVGGNFSASPVLINNRLFSVSEEGEVVVLDAAPQYQLLGRTPLGDPSYATPAVANDRVYFRTFHKLFCLKAKG